MRGAGLPPDVAAVLAASVIPSAITTMDGHFVWVNDAMCAALERPEDEVLGLSWRDLGPERDAHPIGEGLQAELREGKSSMRMRTRYVLGNGQSRWGDLTVTVIRDADGAPHAMLGQMVDVTDEVLADRAIVQSEERYRLLAENMGDVVGTGSPQGLITWVSDSVTGLLGWTPQELIERPFLDLVHEEEHQAVRDVRRQLRAGQPVSYDARLRTKEGGWRWVRIRTQPVMSPAGELAGVVTAWQDINERVESVRRLETVLGTDSLTGLPNRETMEQRMLAVQADMVGPNCHAALLCVGIDRLGDVNSAINHAAGDLILTTVARRIAEVAPDAQLVARGAGVDFLVLLPDLTSTSDAVGIAERIRSEVKKEILVDHRRLRVTASIGIATCHAASTPSELIRSATLAMQAAKDQGRDRLMFDDPSLREEAERLMTLAEHARDGISANRFLPWFMPIVDLDSREVVGYEALMRWDFPGGVLEPKEFTTALVEAGLIGEVDRIIMRQSLAHLAKLPEPTFVSINVSPQALSVPGFSEDVRALVRDAGVAPERVHLELTETSLFRASHEAIAAMTSLATAGVRWYVDDFGTGFSSISHLHDLPIAGLKLDAAFTRALTGGNHRTRRLTQALAGLALGLDLDTVAEGVEDEAQASTLAGQGWRRGQGWLFGQPSPMR